MIELHRALLGTLLAGSVLLSGCGKKEEQPPRFNETLGDSAVGAPLSVGPIDRGILQDPSAYKPADYEPLEPGAAGAAPGGGEAGGPEAQAVKKVLTDLIAAVSSFDVDMVLFAIVPEQVAVLREDDYMSPFYELKDSFDALVAVWHDKVPGAESSSSGELDETLNAVLSVAVLDEENAVATVDLGRLEVSPEAASEISEFAQMLAPMAAALGGAGGAGGGAGTGEAPGAGTPPGEVSPDAIVQALKTVQFSLPFRKVNEEWKLVLPLTLKEEHAQLLSEGAELLKDTCADLTQKIDAAETLDEQTRSQILSSQTGNFMALLGWGSRAWMLFSGGATPPTGEPAPAAGAGEPPEPSEPNEAQEPNAPPPPRRGGGRRP